MWIRWRAHRPFRGDCARCGADVVVVWLDGEDVVLEVEEVLPLMRCPRCAHNVAQGHLGNDERKRARGCARCGDRRVIGREVPVSGVAMAEDGSVRAFTGQWRRSEAVLVPHECIDG
jgi:DNA-directed RNA polymerase subunit RPC12/RpoP